ncbi:MAG: hypothetical protein ACOC56_07160, partial [Atribacterota bacterium]
IYNMRKLTDREVDLLKSSQYRIYLKVFFEDGAGNWVEMTDFEGRNWVEIIEIEDNIDNAHRTFNFTLKRNINKNSLSTLMKNSPYNRDSDDDFSPLLLIGRKFKIEMALTELNKNPKEDWWRIFERGFLEKTKLDSNPLKVEGRGIGAEVHREYIREEKIYGSEDGSPVEDEMQNILNDNNLSHVELSVPESPGWNIYKYKQQKETVFDGLQELAHQIGWELKHRYDNTAEDIKLMFYEPERTPEEVSWIFGPDDYSDITLLELDIADIRNVIKLTYIDSEKLDSDGNYGKKEEITVDDEKSIEDYGEIFMEISESASSNIDTEEEAQRLVNNALHDLKDPKANQEIETLFFFPVQLNDMYAFQANGVHYDEEQRYGVVGFRHEINIRGKKRTYLQTKGRPNMSETGNPPGLHLEWFKREARPGIAKNNPVFPPAQPQNVIARSSLKGITISYDLNSESDLDGYKIYCSDQEDFEVNQEKVVAQGRSTQFNITRYYDESDEEIKNMKSGNTYYLKVRAYDENENLSEVSLEVSAEAGQVGDEDLLENYITDVNNNLSESSPTNGYFLTMGNNLQLCMNKITVDLTTNDEQEFDLPETFTNGIGAGFSAIDNITTNEDKLALSNAVIRIKDDTTITFITNNPDDNADSNFTVGYIAVGLNT